MREIPESYTGYRYIVKYQLHAYVLISFKNIPS